MKNFFDIYVGQIVYYKDKRGIQQAKVTSMVSAFYFSPIRLEIVVSTQYRLLLATGETIKGSKRDTNIYESVEACRKDTPINASANGADVLRKITAAYGIKLNDWRFAMYREENGTMKTLNFSHFQYYHDGNHLYAITGLGLHTIDELVGMGYYTTREEAYNAANPKVICFPGEATKTENKVRVLITRDYIATVDKETAKKLLKQPDEYVFNDGDECCTVEAKVLED